MDSIFTEGNEENEENKNVICYLLVGFPFFRITVNEESVSNFLTFRLANPDEAR
jgi:hypothetical protein